MTFPENGIVVSVTSNTSYADTFDLALKIAQAFAAQGKVQDANDASTQWSRRALMNDWTAVKTASLRSRCGTCPQSSNNRMSAGVGTSAAIRDQLADRIRRGLRAWRGWGSADAEGRLQSSSSRRQAQARSRSTHRGPQEGLGPVIPRKPFELVEGGESRLRRADKRRACDSSAKTCADSVMTATAVASDFRGRDDGHGSRQKKGRCDRKESCGRWPSPEPVSPEG